jgi:hypothetical protein
VLLDRLEFLSVRVWVIVTVMAMVMFRLRAEFRVNVRVSLG